MGEVVGAPVGARVRELLEVRAALASELASSAQARAAIVAAGMAAMARSAAVPDVVALGSLQRLTDDEAAVEAAHAADRGDRSAVGAWLAWRPHVEGIQAAAVRLVDSTAIEAIRADVARLAPALRVVEDDLREHGHGVEPVPIVPPGLPAALRAAFGGAA